MHDQVLDTLDLERERGITIKAQSVCLHYQAQDGITYEFNLIDTPGHVDFSYEVSRSLMACEGALLIVDAAQGVEAQTLATCYSALDQNLALIPVVNKIDLPAADPKRVLAEVQDIIGLETDNAILVSAKTGEGIDALLEAIVQQLPPPKDASDLPLQALVIDSWFDAYNGVVSLVRLMQGSIAQNDKFIMKNSKGLHQVDKLGVFSPKPTERESFVAGEVGFLLAGIKDIQSALVGDTIVSAKDETTATLPGFKRVKPQVYAAVFPTNADQYEQFRDALSKLRLNDPSLEYTPESSNALGFGFRIGYLGLLHMDIVQERLEREYNLDLIATAPTVLYRVLLKSGETIDISNPSLLPDVSKIEHIEEPIAEVNIITPEFHLGNVIKLCTDRRGVQKHMNFVGSQVTIQYHIPLSEVVLDFFDRLKSATSGYASLDYVFSYFTPTDLVKVDVLMNGERVDALSLLVPRHQSQSKGRILTEKLKEIIPRQMFDVAIQAAIGSHVIARQTVKAMRKNVTAKCYGGDISRKRKLLEKQKAGKKRMKQIGRVEVPQDAFLAILRVDKD